MSDDAEFDALVFAAGKVSFFVKDDNDPDGIVHELLFVGAGVTTSKGPIPFGIGGSFSTPDMFSEGVGPIGMRPGKSSGIPPFTVATGRMRSIQFIAPGAGFTAMPCFFTIDP
jgi:hypothetical protein